MIPSPKKNSKKKTAETIILNSPISQKRFLRSKKSLGEWPFCFVIRFMHKVGGGPGEGEGELCAGSKQRMNEFLACGRNRRILLLTLNYSTFVHFCCIHQIPSIVPNYFYPSLLPSFFMQSIFFLLRRRDRQSLAQFFLVYLYVYGILFFSPCVFVQLQIWFFLFC